MAAVRDLLRECYEEGMGHPLIPGRLTEREVKAVADAEAELASEAFAARRAELPRRSLKIAGGTYVRECRRQTVSGRLRLKVRLRGELIDALSVSPGPWRAGARAILGSRLDVQALLGKIGEADDGRELIEALLAISEIIPARSGS